MRSVIVLDPTLHIDEVDMSYKAFVVQYRGHIIRRIVNDKGWTITKASNYLDSKFQYDPYVYSLMCKIIEEESPMLIINRNPKMCGVNHANCGKFLRANSTAAASNRLCSATYVMIRGL